MTTLIALLLPTLLGFLVASLVFNLAGNRETAFLERLCLSYPLGAGILTMQMFILGLLRAPFTLVSLSTPLAIEIAALAFWALRKKIPLMPSRSLGLLKDISAAGTPAWKKATLIFLTIWAGTKMVSIFVETGLRPIYAWDAWANWSTGAKLFYHARGLMLDVPAVDFFTRGAVGRISSYPIHNPLMQTWLSLWAGKFDEVLVKFWSPAYILVCGVYLYLVATRVLNRLASLALLVIFLSSPLMSYHSVEVYSDMPLGVYLFFASAAFLHAMGGSKGYWPLISLFSAEALFVKEEALFYVIPLIISASLFLWKTGDDKPARRTDLLSLFAPLILAAPWFVFKFTHNLGLGANTIHSEFQFHPDVVTGVLSSFASLGNFNIFFIFFPVLLFLGGRPTREFLHLFGVVAFYALFFVALYVFTSLYAEQFGRGTIFYRNVLTYYPAVALLTVFLLKNPVQSFEQQPKARRKK